jgi:hypothetical protein
VNGAALRTSGKGSMNLDYVSIGRIEGQRRYQVPIGVNEKARTLVIAQRSFVQKRTRL